MPNDHFYRHLERTLDLSFVRKFVYETYAVKGYASIDPVIFFKVQPVMFQEPSSWQHTKQSPSILASQRSLQELIVHLNGGYSELELA